MSGDGRGSNRKLLLDEEMCGKMEFVDENADAMRMASGIETDEGDEESAGED
jgi:hypothetical protein